MRYVVVFGLSLLLGVAGAAGAQQDSTMTDSARKARADSSDVLVLEHDYTGPGEFARVFLQKGLVYRAEMSDADASIEIYPIKGGSPVFFSREEPEGPGASNRAVFSVYPRADGMYQIRLISGGPVVTLRLYHDIRASRRRQKILSEPGWEIGAEIGGGFHTGYELNTIGAGLRDSDRSGAHIEACFSARQGPGILRVMSACAFGMAWDTRPPTRGVLWFYLEPRLRLLGGRPRGQSNSEIGILYRVGVGLISKANRNPTIAAPGIYVARNLRMNQGGKGWSFMLAWRHANIGNRGEGVKHTTTEMATFTIGYYQ